MPGGPSLKGQSGLEGESNQSSWLRHTPGEVTSKEVFLDASSHLYNRVCPSVRRSVRRLVGRYRGFLFKTEELSWKKVKRRHLLIDQTCYEPQS